MYSHQPSALSGPDPCPSISAQKPQRKALKTRGMLTQQEIRNIHVSALPWELKLPQCPKAVLGLCSDIL